jgi:hypothetical protein
VTDWPAHFLPSAIEAARLAKNDASKRYADVMNRLGQSYGRFQVSASLAAKSRVAVTRSNALLGKLGGSLSIETGGRPLPPVQSADRRD